MLTPFRHCWRLAHPVWLCGMRPFFLLALFSAVLLPGLWSLVLGAGLAPPDVAGGAVLWHVHELVFGFALAGVAGFALTAIPEFTGTAGATRGRLRLLAALWLLGRLGFWSSGAAGVPALWLAALAHGGLLLGLAWILARPLWSPAGRPHMVFWWALLALAGTVGGFYADALRGVPALRWLLVALGVLMLLIVAAMSRISMRIVNRAIAQTRSGAALAPVRHIACNVYIARPPRRHLAALCITLYTVAEFLRPGSHLAGWLALAAGAAMCHLMADWHVGRALLRRTPLMLYAVYACMALGYGLLGLSQLGVALPLAAGRHLMAMGAMGLAIFAVIAIAGRAHCGLPADTGRAIPVAATLLLLATALRAGAAWAGLDAVWLALAGTLWCLAFAVLSWRIGPPLWRRRSDGRAGCAGPA